MTFHGILFDEETSQPFRIGLPPGTRIQVALQVAEDHALIHHLFLQPAYSLVHRILETR